MYRGHVWRVIVSGSCRFSLLSNLVCFHLMQYIDYFILFNLGTCQRPSWLKHHTIIFASVCYVIAHFHYWSCSSVEAVSFHQTTISSYSASERILGNWSSRFILDWVTQWLWVDSRTDHVLWALHLLLCLMCRLTQLQHKNSELQERCRGKEGEVSCVCVSVHQVGHMLFLTMYMHIVLCYLLVLFFGAVGTVQDETRQLWCHQGECSKVNTWLCWTVQLCFAVLTSRCMCKWLVSLWVYSSGVCITLLVCICFDALSYCMFSKSHTMIWIPPQIQFHTIICCCLCSH